jgi:hypothetical protein
VEPRTRQRWSGWRRRAWWCGKRGAEAHAAQACAGAARQGRSERGPAAGRGGAAAQACRATACWVMVCRENTRGTGGAAVRRLQADPHGSSRAARGERRRPLRRKQQTRSGGTANCSWRIWRWPSAS